MVNCADTVGNLQNLINKLHIYCEKWGLKINTEKTKVMVFRNGCTLWKNERWFLNGRKLEVCTYTINI